MVIVNASMFAMFGRHIYVTISGNGRIFEYRAINQIDAHMFVKRVIALHFPDEEVEYKGDAELNFVYHRQGD